MGRRKKKKRKQNYWSQWWTFNYRERDEFTRSELLELLLPLMNTFKRVDTMAEQFRCGGAYVSDLQKIQEVLSQPIEIQKRRFTLLAPHMARTALYHLCDDLHLEVHAMPDQFPCYFLCKISRHWDGPDIVLDELYLSPRNCFFPDSRFVMLSRNGRSLLFLRLSLFRDRVYEYIQASQEEIEADEECNEILNNVGLLVLGAAWYEDQRLPFHVSDVFGLDNFRSAMELVGFILGSDLYKVATALRDESKYVIDFFEHIYVNRPLAQLLRDISQSKFINFAKLEGKAKEVFLNLNIMFSNFLSTTDVLDDLERFPLYKIILGFFFNLREIADRSFWRPKFEEAIDLIESSADENARAILTALE